MKVKKLIALMLVFVMSLTFVFTLSGCEFSNTALKIESYRLCKDENNEDIIIVKFHFKNNMGYATNMDDEFDVELYQNDIALEEYYPEYNEDGSYVVDLKYNHDDQYKRIKDGGEFYPEKAFCLTDDETDVEVVIGSYFIMKREKTEIIELN